LRVCSGIFSLSSGESGRGKPLVSGRKRDKTALMRAQEANKAGGMRGETSARTPRVVAMITPILAAKEQAPTPAFLTVVGISSDVQIHSRVKVMETQKLPSMERMMTGSLLVFCRNRQITKHTPANNVSKM